MASTQMSVQDALWLTMDRPNNLMVVDGAMTMREQITVDDLKNAMLTTGDRFPVFKRKPVRRGQSWFWVDDPTFDVDNHVTQVDLGGPVDMRQLQDFVAEQRSKPINKKRPLWHSYLLTPVVLDDGTMGSAVVNRFHHAIADGVRLTQLMLGMCEAEDGTVVPTVVRDGTGDGPFDPVAAVTDGAEETARVSVAAAKAAAGAAVGAATDVAGAAVGAAMSAGGAAVGVVNDPAGSLAAAPGALAAVPAKLIEALTGLVKTGLDGVEEGVEVVRHPDRLLDALEVLGVEDHRSINDLSSVTKLLFTDSGHAVWSGKPGTKKAVSWSKSMPLSEIKRIGKAHDATINDVLLAAIAGGLRAYLEQHDDSLEEVVWMVPVNLKPFADNLPPELGNYFALVMLPMPLDHLSSQERLAEMHHRMARIKHSDEAVLTFGLQRTVSLSPSNIAFFLTNFFANKAVGVLTNVPGPTGRLTFAGAPVEQVVGFAPCSGNQPMTATIFSYNGTVTVGFATDAKLLPDPDTLADLVVHEIQAMKKELSTRKRRPKPTPTPTP